MAVASPVHTPAPPAPPAPPPATPPAPPPAVLRGRDGEQRAITALLEQAATGHGAGLLLLGEPGMGKSALLALAAQHATAAGWAVLTTAGVADEAHLPYAGLHRLLLPLLEAPPRDGPATGRRSAWVGRGGPEVRVVAQLFNGGYRRSGPGEERAGAARLAQFSAVVGVLRTASSQVPLLCCVDDTDAMDPASRSALAFTARRLAGSRVALLATATTLGTSGGPEPPVPMTARLLGPLDPQQSLAALADLVPGGLPGPMARALARLAAGNPQALADLTASLSPAQRAGTAPPPRTLPAGSTLRRAYQRRLHQLPADTQWLLLLAAAGAGRDPRLLAKAARRSGVDIDALAPAERAGLVTAGRRGIRFSNPKVGRAAYEAAPLARRRRALLDIAEATAAGGELRRAARAMARAAELTCRGPELARRLLAAARYAWLAGEPDRARRLLHRARSVATGSGDPELQLLDSDLNLRTGEPQTALSTALAIPRALAGRRRGVAAQALRQAVEAAWLSGDHTRYGEIARDAATLWCPGAPAAEQQLLAFVLGFTASFQGRPREAVAALHQAVQLAEQLDEVGAWVVAAWAGVLLADYAASQRLAARAVAAARARGYLAAVPLALELHARAAFGLGHYELAATSSRDGVSAARATGQASYLADHLATLGVLAAIRDDRPACQRWLRELVIPSGAGPGSRPAALSQWAQAILDLTSGNAAGAAARLAALGDPATGSGQVAVQLMAAPWLVEAATRAGRERPAARRVLTVFNTWATSTAEGLPRALAARCRALLAGSSTPASMAYFQEALTLHQPGECDFERARTLLLFGEQLRRWRQPRQARSHLHQALETFQQLSLAGWAARAAAELRAAGEQTTPPGSSSDPAPPSPEAGTEALTPQQLRVARLVASGATNREVAAQLFLSPRTVDHHLRNVFCRLGIRSRVELARRLP